MPVGAGGVWNFDLKKVSWTLITVGQGFYCYSDETLLFLSSGSCSVSWKDEVVYVQLVGGAFAWVIQLVGIPNPFKLYLYFSSSLQNLEDAVFLGLFVGTCSNQFLKLISKKYSEGSAETILKPLTYFRNTLRNKANYSWLFAWLDTSTFSCLE